MGNEKLWDAVCKLRDLRDQADAAMNEIGAAGFCDGALEALAGEVDQWLDFLMSVRRKAGELTKKRRKQTRRSQTKQR